MNNRTGGPRSFNTVKRSNREDRLRRRRQGRMTLLAMCVVVLLLAITGLVFLICHVAIALQKPPAPVDPDQPDGNTSGILWQMESRQYSDIYTGELIVVNLSHEFHFPASEQLEEITSRRETVDGKVSYIVRNVNEPPKMKSAASVSLNRMLAQYYSISGSQLVVYDAYRTLQQQSKNPGKSEHHTGLLAALSDSTSSPSKLDLSRHSWLLENCDLYGFIQRYPASKSGITGIGYDYSEAFRYVGIPHATYITANNLCLEEYVELLKNNHTSQNGTDGKRLAVDTNKDGKADYEIYYVPANPGAGVLTTVPVPQNFEYTVSGDNIGGFIVTVNLNALKTAA